MSILRDVKCRNDINSEKIPVPGRIWTHDLPWFSQTLQPLSYWRPYGEQDEMWLEAHHAVTQLNDDLAHKNSPTAFHLELEFCLCLRKYVPICLLATVVNPSKDVKDLSEKQELDHYEEGNTWLVEAKRDMSWFYRQQNEAQSVEERRVSKLLLAAIPA